MDDADFVNVRESIKDLSKDSPYFVNTAQVILVDQMSQSTVFAEFHLNIELRPCGAYHGIAVESVTCHLPVRKWSC